MELFRIPMKQADSAGWYYIVFNALDGISIAETGMKVSYAEDTICGAAPAF